jgi:hypothetical protein
MRAEYGVNDGRDNALAGGDLGAAIHQYTSVGRLAGCSGFVDLSHVLRGDQLIVPKPKPSRTHVSNAVEWRWARWRLGLEEYAGHAKDPELRPKRAPRRIPLAWYGKVRWYQKHVLRPDRLAAKAQAAADAKAVRRARADADRRWERRPDRRSSARADADRRSSGSEEEPSPQAIDRGEPVNVLHQIATDSQLQTILLLIAADVVLGVAASFKDNGQPAFALAYLANFARNDVLGKAVPWATLDALAIAAGSAHVLVPQFDLTNAAHAAFIGVSAALVGSLLGSLKDLGLDLIPAQLGSGR